MVSIETIEQEIIELEKRDTSYAVCERLAWLYTVHDHLKAKNMPVVSEVRKSGKLTGSEFLEVASEVDYVELMRVIDNHMTCIKTVCPKEYDAVMSQIRMLA